MRYFKSYDRWTKRQGFGIKKDEILTDFAKLGVRNTFALRMSQKSVYVKRHKKGIPNYGLGHMANVEEIMKEAKE